MPTPAPAARPADHLLRHAAQPGARRRVVAMAADHGRSAPSSWRRRGSARAAGRCAPPSTVTPRGACRGHGAAAASPLRVPRTAPSVAGRIRRRWPRRASPGRARGCPDRAPPARAATTCRLRAAPPARCRGVRDHGAAPSRRAATASSPLPAAPDHDQVGAAGSRFVDDLAPGLRPRRLSSSSATSALRIATQRGDALARRLGVGTSWAPSPRIRGCS